jgi:leucine dehydrogenase
MNGLFESMESGASSRLCLFTDAACGLRAILAIDDLTLGPAAGGTRTWTYPSPADGAADAMRLARAMTLKCSIAGVDAGGGKMVVLDHPGLDRPAAFRVLGERVEELGGIFVTAGDAGTRHEDLLAMAERTRFVHVDEGDLSGAVADGLAGCIRACAQVAGRGDLGDLTIAVQGCGAIGGAVAARLTESGAHVKVADVNPAAAAAVAARTGAEIVDPAALLTTPADILAPCALGGVLTTETVPELRVWAVCGAANNVLASAAARDLLAARGILFVPDVIASAGAVIQGICEDRGQTERAGTLIAALESTAGEVLREAERKKITTTEAAERRALRRISEARC